LNAGITTVIRSSQGSASRGSFVHVSVIIRGFTESSSFRDRAWKHGNGRWNTIIRSRCQSVSPSCQPSGLGLPRNLAAELPAGDRTKSLTQREA
jgi:hypothetical protein